MWPSRSANASLASQITTGARAFRRVLTPLQQEIYLVLRIVLLIVVYFEFLLVLMSILRQINFAESVENSTIVAGLVPNGLFLSIAVAYALGAVRILRFGALVQQANAIESLSHVNILCLDKTGTLTANRLQVDDLHPLDSVSQTELAAALGALAAGATSRNKTTEALAAAFHPHIARCWPIRLERPAEFAAKPTLGQMRRRRSGNRRNTRPGRNSTEPRKVPCIKPKVRRARAPITFSFTIWATAWRGSTV